MSKDAFILPHIEHNKNLIPALELLNEARHAKEKLLSGVKVPKTISADGYNATYGEPIYSDFPSDNDLSDYLSSINKFWSCYSASLPSMDDRRLNAEKYAMQSKLAIDTLHGNAHRPDLLLRSVEAIVMGEKEDAITNGPESAALSNARINFIAKYLDALKTRFHN